MGNILRGASQGLMVQGVSGSVPVFVVKGVYWRAFNTITIVEVNFNS